MKFIINTTSKTLKQQENYNIETIHSPTAYTHKVREPDKGRPFMSGSEGRRYLNPTIIMPLFIGPKTNVKIKRKNKLIWEPVGQRKEGKITYQKKTMGAVQNKKRSGMKR